MKLTTKFLIALWVLSPVIAQSDVWIMGEGAIPRLVLCWIELGLLTVGYWLGKQEWRE